MIKLLYKVLWMKMAMICYKRMKLAKNYSVQGELMGNLEKVKYGK